MNSKRQTSTRITIGFCCIPVAYDHCSGHCKELVNCQANMMANKLPEVLSSVPSIVPDYLLPTWPHPNKGISVLRLVSKDFRDITSQFVMHLEVGLRWPQSVSKFIASARLQTLDLALSLHQHLKYTGA